MNFYQRLKNFGKETLDVFKFIGRYPLESTVIGSTLLGIGCSNREEQKPKFMVISDLEFYGKVDSFNVVIKRMYNVWVDSIEKKENMIDIDFPSGLTIRIDDVNNDGVIDGYNLAVRCDPSLGAVYVPVGNTVYNPRTNKMEEFTRKRCQEIYDSVKRKIEKQQN